jgi:hypothetical protein
VMSSSSMNVATLTTPSIHHLRVMSVTSVASSTIRQETLSGNLSI